MIKSSFEATKKMKIFELSQLIASKYFRRYINKSAQQFS